MKRVQDNKSSSTTSSCEPVCYVCDDKNAVIMMGECGHTLCGKCVDLAIKLPPENCAVCRCEKVKQDLERYRKEDEEGDALDQDLACHEMFVPLLLCLVIPCLSK
jgi:hypothetical protein